MLSAWWRGDFPITQPYGCTDFASEGYNPNHPECPYFHEGIDIGLPCGTVLFSGVNGTIVNIGANGYGPYALTIRSGNYDIWLGHLQAAYLNLNDNVRVGNPVGESDNLGFSTGCHLHFEVRPAGAPYRSSVDPLPWLGTGIPGPLALGVPPLPWSYTYGRSSMDAFKQGVREVLDEGTGQGQTSWADTNKAQLATSQQAINDLSALADAVAKLAPLITGVTPAQLAAVLDAAAAKLRTL